MERGTTSQFLSAIILEDHSGVAPTYDFAIGAACDPVPLRVGDAVSSLSAASLQDTALAAQRAAVPALAQPVSRRAIQSIWREARFCRIR